jgi:hypothetical protein
MVAAALGNPLRAARLWGAEERLREEIGPARSAGQETDPQMRDARAAAGDGAAFDRAWQEGRAMPLEQAIEFAISSGHA